MIAVFIETGLISEGVSHWEIWEAETYDTIAAFVPWVTFENAFVALSAYYHLQGSLH